MLVYLLWVRWGTVPQLGLVFLFCGFPDPTTRRPSNRLMWDIGNENIRPLRPNPANMQWAREGAVLCLSFSKVKKKKKSQSKKIIAWPWMKPTLSLPSSHHLTRTRNAPFNLAGRKRGAPNSQIWGSQILRLCLVKKTNKEVGRERRLPLPNLSPPNLHLQLEPLCT